MLSEERMKQSYQNEEIYPFASNLFLETKSPFQVEKYKTMKLKDFPLQLKNIFCLTKSSRNKHPIFLISLMLTQPLSNFEI